MDVSWSEPILSTTKIFMEGKEKCLLNCWLTQVKDAAIVTSYLINWPSLTTLPLPIHRQKQSSDKQEIPACLSQHYKPDMVCTARWIINILAYPCNRYSTTNPCVLLVKVNYYSTVRNRRLLLIINHLSQLSVKCWYKWTQIGEQWKPIYALVSWILEHFNFPYWTELSLLNREYLLELTLITINKLGKKPKSGASIH